MIDISNTRPLVSVIIPTYKQEKLLINAISSVLAQSYRNIELIVVDDNSDESNISIKSIIEQINDKRLIYIKNTVNLGSARTRNVGINFSKGEYITFLDDDDEYYPDKVYTQLSEMMKNNSDYSTTNMLLVNDKSEVIGKRERRQIKKCKSLFIYHMLYHLTGTSTMMYKRNFLFRIGLFNSIDIGDEFYLIQRSIEANGSFTHVDKILVSALVHKPGSGLSLGDKRRNGEITLFNFKKRYFDKLSIYQRQFVRMRHHLVMARIHLKNNEKSKFAIFLTLAFFSNPIGFFDFIVRGI